MCITISDSICRRIGGKSYLQGLLRFNTLLSAQGEASGLKVGIKRDYFLHPEHLQNYIISFFSKEEHLYNQPLQLFCPFFVYFDCAWSGDWVFILILYF